MTEADIYEEVLKGVPDDARVSLTCQDGDKFIVYVGRKKSELVWSKRMLLMKSVEHTRKQRSDMARIHMHLIPTDRISSVEVSYDVDTDDLLEVANTESKSVSQPLTFGEFDLNESEYESLFGDGSPMTGSAFSFGASSSMSNLPAHGRVFSSYDREGLFVNCFHLRNTTAWEHNRAYDYDPCSNYREQWEPYVGGYVMCEGTLTEATPHGSCIQLKLGKNTVTATFADAKSCCIGQGSGIHRLSQRAKANEQPVNEITVLVASDYEVPPIGSELQIRGRVYAYPLKSKHGMRRQLGLDVMAIG